MNALEIRPIQREGNMKRLLSVTLIALVTLAGMVGSTRAGNAVSVLQATAKLTTGAVTEQSDDTIYDRDPTKAKMYYLTVTSFNGGDAITACDSGFHMASISEILDPSSLQYDTMRSTPAFEEPSYYQGFGPPSDQMGWVRTGFFPIADKPDYSDFSMSGFDQHSGTTLSLHTQIWGDPYTDPYPTDTETGWHVNQIAYNRPQQVWCVEGSE